MTNPNPERSIRTFRLMVHFAGAAAVLAISVCAGLLVYSPAMADQSRLDQEIAATREFMSQKDRLQNESTELQQHLAAMEQQFQEAVTRIPETVRETEFLGQISELAGRSGLKMRDYRPGQVVERADYREMQITVSADADYGSLCTFLHGLRKLDRLCQVTSLNVSEAGIADGVYPVNMTIAVFFAPLDNSEASKGNTDAAS